MAASIVNIFVRIEWREVIEFLSWKLLLEKKIYINKKNEGLLCSKLSEKRGYYFLCLEVNQWSLHLTEKSKVKRNNDLSENSRILSNIR